MNEERTSIFNPVEQRLYGLVFIATGIVMVFRGKNAPNWTLRYALWGAQRAHNRRERGERSTW